MMTSILLLDCSSTLMEKLKHQGFDVVSGTMGFCTGNRYLPCQLYEKDVLIYNPTYCGIDPNIKGYFSVNRINDTTPAYTLKHMREHILRGATLLIFVNYIATYVQAERAVYSWIPFMPDIVFTKDNKVSAVKFADYEKYNFLSSIVFPEFIKTPVMQKLEWPTKSGTFSFFYNMNNDVLGAIIEPGRGKLIILPQCKSNEEIISTFLHRVIPKLYDLEARTNLIDEYVSPEEYKATKKVNDIDNMIKELNESIETETEKLNSARRIKIQTVNQDETATRILKYHNLAVQQEDVALFYLYKIIESLQHKYGGEQKAKGILGCNTEWNLIGKLANISYADIRHAPKPDEKIKEWTPDELEKCFKAEKKIIHAYLGTLFPVHNESD